MDPQHPQPPPDINNSNQQESKLSFLKNKKLLIAATLIVLLLAILGLIVTLVGGEKNTDNKERLTEAERKYQEKRRQLAKSSPPSSIIVYGALTNSGNEIYAYDLENTNEYLITTLPSDIKTISVLGGNELMYMSHMSDLDHAKRIVVKNLENDSEKIIYELIDNYGIDIYLLSPDKSRVVTWEIELGPTGIMQGGRSRINTFSIANPKNVTTVIEENISDTSPIFYPVLITSDGKVYMDRFLPNSGSGWAYGMSVSDTTTGTITQIPSMTNGTYSTRPIASPDGSNIAFVGYDGTKGSGTEVINGHRKALIHANTIELLDTSTNERNRLPNLESTNTYLKLFWGSNNTLIYSSLNKNLNIDSYTYNISLSSPQQLTTPENTFTISQLSQNAFLQGTITDESSKFISNLGSKTYYQYSYTRLAIKNTSDSSSIEIPLTSPIIQYIDTIQNNSAIRSTEESTIQQIPGFPIEKIIDFGDLTDSSHLQLQLKTLVFPTEAVEEKREETVNDPPIPTPTTTSSPKEGDKAKPEYLCNTLSIPICLAQMGYEKESQVPISKRIEFNQCRAQLNIQFKSEGKCLVSPLYLYGPSGLKVDVKVHTPIFNKNIPSDNGNYTFRLGNEGLFYSNSRSYSSLAFDYIPQKKLNPPTYGKVVRKAEVENITREYAKELGLNTRETNDLVNDIQSKVTKDFAFISFYSEDVSKFLLPITFDPHPNTYINYIFYIKNLNSPQDLGYSPRTPEFPIVEERGEFTAVEISLTSE